MRIFRFIVLTVVVAVVLSACITQAGSYSAQNPRSASAASGLSAPTLSAQQTSAGIRKGTLTVSWSAVTGATGYQLQMKTGNESEYGSPFPGGNLTGTSVSLPNLITGVPHHFRMRAVNVNSGAESPWSAVLTATLGAAEAPPPTP